MVRVCNARPSRAMFMIHGHGEQGEQVANCGLEDGKDGDITTPFVYLGSSSMLVQASAAARSHAPTPPCAALLTSTVALRRQDLQRLNY